MVFDSGLCRAAVSGDCSTNGNSIDGEIPEVAAGVLSCTACDPAEIEDPGGLVCRSRAAADCGAMIFDSGSCRAAVSNDCPTNGEIPNVALGLLSCEPCRATEVEADSGLSCRNRIASDCGNMVFDSGSCRVAESGDCRTDGEIPGTITNGVAACDSCPATEVEDTDGLSCRPRIAADCGAMVFDSGLCRFAVGNDCATNGEISDGRIPAINNGILSCEPCPQGMPENPVGLSCRPLAAADCGARIFVSGSPSSCRDAVENDCSRVGQIPNVAAGVLSCTACSGATPVEQNDGLTCRARVAGDCGANQFLVGGDCRLARASDCPNSGEIPDVADGLLSCRACNELLTGGVSNTAGSACICPSNMREFDNTGGINFCAAPLPILRYTTNDCTSAGWLGTVQIDSANRSVRQLCQIPVRIDVNFTGPPNSSGLRALSANNLRPLVVTDGSEHDACVLTRHAGFTGADFPDCHDPQLFGEARLPVRPRAFIAEDTGATRHRLIVAAAVIPPNAPNDPAAPPPPLLIYFDDGAEILIVDRFSPGGGGGGGDYGEIAMGVGAAAFVGLIVYNSWTGNPNSFSFSPETSFSHQNGWTNYSYGSRLEFREDNLSAYWSAVQKHSAGETDSWEYGTGIKYTKDFWSAGFDSVNYGETAAWDISFAAQWQSGIWRWQSGINADYRLDESGEDAAVYWNTNLLLLYNRWAISPSVGLYWREDESFGEDARIRINLRREF